jgi:hypothetical protein
MLLVDATSSFVEWIERQCFDRAQWLAKPQERFKTSVNLSI